MEKQQPVSIWLGMSHIVVYWIDDAMYTEAFTKLFCLRALCNQAFKSRRTR